MGLFSKVGGALNNVTGATAAAKQSQQFAIQSAKLNNQYQKEFAQNAHQWEIQDLQSAGLNPILSAGGNGASASGGGVASATETSAGLNPFEAAGGAINAINGILTGKQIKASVDNTDADTLLKKAQTQMQLLDFALKSKMSEDIVNELKTNIKHTEEQIKLLKGGKSTGILGTDLGGKMNKGWNWIIDKLAGVE